MAAPPSDSFGRILAQFKTRLTPQQEIDFAATSLPELQITVAAIQQRQASTRTMQNLNRLAGFLEAVQTYSTVLDVFVNVHNFVAFIWGPVKYLLLVASTFADAFNALLDAYKRIAENLPTLAQYQALFDANPAMQQALETIFEDIFEFHAQALKYFKGSVWKQMFQATWKQFDTKFKGLLDNMSHHKRLVETQASLIEFREAKVARERAAKAFDEQEQHEVLRRKTYLFGWLSAADVQSDQMRGVQARKDHPQSGKWLLSKDLLRNWFDPQVVFNATLWITGILGAGKTVLASLIIKESKALSGVQTLYFYFRDGDQQRNSFVAMARSLILQSLYMNDNLVSVAFEAAVASEEVALSTGKTAGRLLETCLKAQGVVYLILDGLDECPVYEQRHIVSWLRKHVDSTLSTSEPARCIFLSQDDGVTRSLFSKTPTLRISHKDNAADIEAFCRSWVTRIHTKFQITDDEALNIVSTTASRANGMFLFAKLVMSNLYDQTRRSGLDAELHPDVFPQGLQAAYDRVVARVLDHAPPSVQKDAHRLLAWLVCALRPLKWREIQAAVSMDSDEEKIDYAKHQLMVDSKQLCGSLIEECPDGEITLVHSSAKSYLTNAGRINLEKESLKLADLCVEYLCFPIFERNMDDSNVDKYLLDGSYALFEYALMAWSVHLEHGLAAKLKPAEMEELETTLSSFFEFHWKASEKRSRPLKNMEDTVAVLQDTDVKAKLLQSMASMHALSSGISGELKSVATIDLFDVLYRIRQRTEGLIAESNTASVLERYYGTKLFKCHKPYCKWFHEGFNTEMMRKAHLEKHERSHFCSFAGCTRATLGFATKRELEEHVVDYHKPDPTEDDFPDLDKAEGDERSAKTRKREAERGGEHLCSTCSKGFKRASNLRAHQRIHDKAETFPCSICDKSFGRLVDKVRHEKLHSGEKDFICLRKSHLRTELGCGKTFSRSDQLSRHLNSKSGQACRQAMLDDEAAWQTVKIPSIDYVHHEGFDFTGLSPQHVRLLRYAHTEDGSSTYSNPLTRPKLPASIEMTPTSLRRELQLVDIEMLAKAGSQRGCESEADGLVPSVEYPDDDDDDDAAAATSLSSTNNGNNITCRERDVESTAP